MVRARGPQALLAQACIRHAGLVVALAALASLCALRALLGADVEALPRIHSRLVEVRARVPGLGPRRVESLATAPMERALAGLPGLQRMTSRSTPGLALLRLRFAPSVTASGARAGVRSRLDSLHLGVLGRSPRVGPARRDRALVLAFGLTAPALGPMRLRGIARWQLRPRLLAVPGVASVRMFGGRDRALMVRVRARSLQRFGVGIEQVLRVARQAVAEPGAGCVETAQQRLLLRAEPPGGGARGLAEAVLRVTPSRVLTLADVAKVGFGPLPARSAATIGATPGMELVVRAQPGASTLRVTRGVERTLGRLRALLTREGVVLHAPVLRPADLLRRALRELAWSLALGLVLALGVLRLLLPDWRLAGLCASASALTLLFALGLTAALGWTLDLQRLAAAGFGALLAGADALWLLDTWRRRPRDARQVPGAARASLCEAAVHAQRSSLPAGAALLLVLLLPQLVPGATSRLLGAVAQAAALSLLVCLLVGATLTPALAALVLGSRPSRASATPMLRGLRRRYMALQARLMTRWRAGALLAAALVAAGAWAALHSRDALLAGPREGPFIVRMRLAPGSSLQASMLMGARVAEALQGLPQVRLATHRVADAGPSGGGEGAAHSRFEIALRVGADPAQALQRIREVLAGFAGATFRIDSLFARRLRELGGAGRDADADVVVDLSGAHLGRIELAAKRAAAVLRAVPGATGVQLAVPPRLPQLRLRLRAQALRASGSRALGVLRQVRTALVGGDAGHVFVGAQPVPVRVVLGAGEHGGPQLLGALPISTPRRGMVPLGSLGAMHLGTAPARIEHVDGVRTLRVLASTSSAHPTRFVRAASLALRSQLRLPPGVTLRLRLPAARHARQRAHGLAGAMLAGAAVLLLLGLRLRQGRQLFLALLGLAVAWAGALLLSWLSATRLGLGTGLGMLALGGVALRNTLAMFAQADSRMGSQVSAWDADAGLRLAGEGLEALLTVSFAWGFGVLALALTPQLGGWAVAGPMARALLGGLGAWLAYELFVLPPLALRLGVFSPPRRSTPTGSSR